MITQKAISLKIDKQLLDELDKEVALGWNKRNNHINRAIKLYLAYKDVGRKIRALRDLSDKKKVLQDFIKEWFPMMPEPGT